MSQCSPIFHPDNTAIYGEVPEHYIIFSWSQIVERKTPYWVWPDCSSSFVSPYTLGFSSWGFCLYPHPMSYFLLTCKCWAIYLAGYESTQPHTFFISCLEPSVEFTHIHLQLILFDPVGHCSKLCFKNFLYFLRIFAWEVDRHRGSHCNFQWHGDHS